MTPEQLNNTMNFFLRNHANAMARMDRFDEELREQKLRIEELGVETKDLVQASRNQLEHNTRMEEIVRILAEIQASQATRLKWIEDQGK